MKIGDFVLVDGEWWLIDDICPESEGSDCVHGITPDGGDRWFSPDVIEATKERATP